MTQQITAIYRYPVKSMQGEQITESDVTSRGLTGDRAFALVDIESGKIASAHNPEKWGILLYCRAEWTGTTAVVTLPNGERHEIGPQLEKSLSKLCKREVRFIREAAPGAAYEFMNSDVEAAAPESFVESTLKRAGVRDGRLGWLRVGMQADNGSLVDVAALHILTESSLNAFAKGGGDPDVRRFRPNIVIGSDIDAGYVEDTWTGRQLKIGSAVATISIPTPRCLITTLDQANGVVRNRQSLIVLARDNRLEFGPGRWACLGSYASVETPGTIKVGDLSALIPTH